MRNLDRISIDPRICQGQPIIRGMRITVSAVLKVLAAGKTVQDVLNAYPELEEEDVRQAIEYAQHRDASYFGEIKRFERGSR